MLPEEVNSKVSNREKERVKEEDKYRHEMKRVENWQKEEISSVIFAFIESSLSSTNLEKKIFFLVEETSKGKSNNQAQY